MDVSEKGGELREEEETALSELEAETQSVLYHDRTAIMLAFH